MVEAFLSPLSYWSVGAEQHNTNTKTTSYLLSSKVRVSVRERGQFDGGQHKK